MSYVDQKLIDAVDKFQVFTDKDTRRQASKQMGEIFDHALDKMSEEIEKEIQKTVDAEEDSEGSEKIGFDEEELFY